MSPADLAPHLLFEYHPALLAWMKDHKSDLLPAALESEAREFNPRMQLRLMVFSLQISGLAVKSELKNGALLWEPTWRFWNRIGKVEEIDPTTTKLDDEMRLEAVSLHRDIAFMIAAEAIRVAARSRSGRWLDRFEDRVCKSFKLYNPDFTSEQQKRDMEVVAEHEVHRCFEPIRQLLEQGQAGEPPTLQHFQGFWKWKGQDQENGN
jgi:hypothetical protein